MYRSLVLPARDSRLRRTERFNPVLLPVMDNPLHEPVRFVVTESARSPEKSRAFLIKLFSRDVLTDQPSDPIFSFAKRLNLWVATRPILTDSQPTISIYCHRKCTLASKVEEG